MAKQNVNMVLKVMTLIVIVYANLPKVNENFTELYAVLGVRGQINFTTLSDTPRYIRCK